MSVVSRHLDYDASYLHRQFPDLCGAISARYKAHVQARKAERLKEVQTEVQTEVQQIVHAIHNTGLYPSYRRVQALLSTPRQMHEQEALHAWHDALQRLETVERG
jgi:hypothetical protein